MGKKVMYYLILNRWKVSNIFFSSDLYMREKVDGNNAGSKFNLLLYTGLER